jgi:hypothetical protein
MPTHAAQIFNGGLISGVAKSSGSFHCFKQKLLIKLRELASRLTTVAILSASPWILSLAGCASDSRDHDGSEINVVVRPFHPEEALQVIRSMKGVSIESSQLAETHLKIILHRPLIGPHPSYRPRAVLEYRTTMGEGHLRIHALALGSGFKYLEDVEFALIDDIYLHLRRAEPELPEPRKITVTRNYGYWGFRKLQD